MDKGGSKHIDLIDDDNENENDDDDSSNYTKKWKLTVRLDSGCFFSDRLSLYDKYIDGKIIVSFDLRDNANVSVVNDDEINNITLKFEDSIIMSMSVKPRRMKTRSLSNSNNSNNNNSNNKKSESSNDVNSNGSSNGGGSTDNNSNNNGKYHSNRKKIEIKDCKLGPFILKYIEDISLNRRKKEKADNNVNETNVDRIYVIEEESNILDTYIAVCLERSEEDNSSIKNGQTGITKKVDTSEGVNKRKKGGSKTNSKVGKGHKSNENINSNTANKFHSIHILCDYRHLALICNKSRRKNEKIHGTTTTTTN